MKRAKLIISHLTIILALIIIFSKLPFVKVLAQTSEENLPLSEGISLEETSSSENEEMVSERTLTPIISKNKWAINEQIIVKFDNTDMIKLNFY